MTAWPLPQGTYAVRHRVPGFGGGLVAEGFNVADEHGTDVLLLHYRLHGTTMTWSIVTPDDTERGRMEHPMMSMHPHFTIDRPGQATVTVRKANFALMHETWRIEGLECGDLDVHGDVANHEFTFTDAQGITQASASRAYLTLHEGYSVRTAGLDPLIAICAAIGLDVTENSRDH